MNESIGNLNSGTREGVSSEHDLIDLSAEKTSYREPRISILKNWEVRIRALNHGCVIHVGCKDFAFSNLEEGLVELNAFYADPHTAIEKWEKIENELNNK